MELSLLLYSVAIPCLISSLAVLSHFYVFPNLPLQKRQFLSEAAPLPAAVICSEFVALPFLALQPPASPEDAMLFRCSEKSTC